MTVVVDTSTTVPLPGSLPVTSTNGAFEAGTLTGAGGQYSGTLALSSTAVTGPTSVQVRLDLSDAGFVEQLALQVDKDPPALASWDAGTPPARAGTWVSPGVWRRDEAPTVTVDFDEDVGSATLTLSGQAQSGTCAGTRCVFTAQLWTPAMAGLTASFPMNVMVADTRGNDAMVPLGMLQVTRRRWEVALSGTPEVRAGLALDDQGTVYVGTRATGTGTLEAYTSDTGAQRWSRTVGAVLSVAVDNLNDEVFYAANAGTTGTIGAVKTDGGVSGIGSACQSTLNTTHVGVALPAAGTAVGVLNSNGAAEGAFCRVRVGAASSLRLANTDFALDGGALDVGSVPNQVESAANIVVDGTTAFLPTRNGAVLAIQNVTASPSVDGTRSISLSKSGVAPWPLTGLAATSSASTLAVTGQGTIAGFFLPAPGTMNASSLDATTSFGAPIFVGPTAWSGAQTAARLRRFTGATGTDSATTQSWVSASPLAGRDAANTRTRVYAVDAAGWVTVVDDAMPSTREWQADLGLGEVRAPPTLDCNRLNATSSTGVLYVASTTGKVASYIVDSVRLANASWPKYQKDAANSGNTDSANFQLNPGCPP